VGIEKASFSCAAIEFSIHCPPMNQRRRALFILQQAIRNFFNQKEFIDVLTPPMVQNPGMETHIHPFQVHQAIDKKHNGMYLHTSPEFHMKELLADGFEKIFTLSYCFRNEPDSDNHRAQFIMLEWYRANSNYQKIMDDVEELFIFCKKELEKNNIELDSLYDSFTPIRKTIQEIFLEVLNIDILDYLEKDKLRDLIATNFKDVPLPNSDEGMEWDDYYFLLFLNKVEPKLEEYPFILLYEFPKQLAALSTLKEDDKRVCERFEVYCKGIELCNCFNELRDIAIQKERFNEQRELKKSLYNYELPNPDVLYSSLEKGFPETGGIALGVERLLKVLTGNENPFY
jgi:lysyl-tRNA synthetase class 2